MLFYYLKFFTSLRECIKIDEANNIINKGCIPKLTPSIEITIREKENANANITDIE